MDWFCKTNVLRVKTWRNDEMKEGREERDVKEVHHINSAEI